MLTILKGKKLLTIIYLLAEIKDLKRYRGIQLLIQEILQKISSNAHRDIKKLMPFIHLPIQSGSNKILKKMNRNHTINDYLQKIEKLKK